MKLRSLTLVLLLVVSIMNFIAKADDPGSAMLSLDLISTDIGQRSENNCVLRDRYGFLWVGSQNGLQCYDGNGNAVYHPNMLPMRAISNIPVSALHQNGDDIWIAGEGGLFVFNRLQNSISPFKYKTAYGVNVSASVSKMFQAAQGRIWISTHGQGFFIFDPADSTLTQNSRHASFYSDMAIGANGLIYLASIDGHIQAFKPDGQFVSQSRLPDYVGYKNKISVAASGRDIWISSGPVLFRLDTSTGKIEKILSNEGGGIINSLLARPDGSLLLGTNSGIWSYNTVNGGAPVHVNLQSKSGRPSDVRVSAMVPDTNGDIILIHPTGALESLTVKSPAFRFVEMPRAESGFGYNPVRAIALSHDRSGLWIGSDRGLDYYDLRSGSFDRSKLPPIDNIPVTALSVQGPRLWIGTQACGVYLYDTAGGDMRHFTYSENIPYSIVSNEINHIFSTSAGEVYILTNWGICRYDPAADNFPQLKELDQQIRGVTMQEDSRGGLWIATAADGLFYRAPGESRFHNKTTGTNGETIPVALLHRDKKGRLWAATQNHGLFLYNSDEDTFPNFEISLLNHKTVTFISDDISDDLWIGAEDILLRLDNKQNVTLFNFGHQNDWTPVAGVTAALDGGKTVIGCRNGLLFFDPYKLKAYDDKIKVFPLSLSFPFLDDSGDELLKLGLDPLLYTRHAISLPYDRNTFTIHLAATRPTSLPDIRYDYCLEGVDKAWITGSSANEVTYNNLPPGEYRFLLRPHGLPDAAVSTLDIAVLPPWYRTTWAYAVYLVLLLCVAAVATIIIRKVLRRKYHRQLHDMRIQKEREVFEAKSRYFVDLVHEIRTPLMLISLPLEQLAEDINSHADTAGKSKPRYIKSMQRNIDYLLGITNQLLDFRRAENSSEIQLSLSRCDVRQLISDICRRFDEPLKISGKDIELCLPDRPVMATIDKDKTERLLMNLIGNAMKYARHQITVSLHEATAGDMLNIAVADDGPGVPPEERERIFDAYYQIGNDNVAASLGTGLGLAYAKLIANAHKGDITVSENPGGGALFTITLPVGADLVPQEQNIEEDTAGELPETAPEDKSKTILLVEDNDDLRGMITEALGKHYTVITAIDGVMALDILAANDIDVIVSDVMMPRMNGLELCRKVKSDFNHSHIPFIILTAKTGREAQAEGMECGADVYLEKPFPIRQLVYQIRNLMKTRELFYRRIRTSAGEIAADSPAPVSATAGLNRLDAEFLTRMNTIIQESIANEDLSIDLIAEKLNLSRSSFYRKITAVTGMSPSDYLKNFRLNHAASLLSDGCRVTEVAYRSGFTSSSYFAKCFKEKFGVLPSDYVARSTRRAENGQ